MARRGAEPDIVNLRAARARCSDRFLAGLVGASRVTLVSHVHPDPDSLGSMLGLAHMVECCLGTPTRLTRDGLISRAENRAMVEYLNIDLEPIKNIVCQPGEVLVMVDSQPNTGRHSFGAGMPIYAVIDHHRTMGQLEGIPYVDVRHGLGATCSLVTRYLIEQDLPLPTRVATALCYGIETELSGYPRQASSLDDGALQYLYPLADKDLLARIRNAPLPHCYYDCLLQALQNSFVYDRLLISWIQDMEQPELAAAIADIMIRYEKVDWAVCVGVYQDKLILSARSQAPDAQAGELLQEVVGELGRAGGHDRRAGGTIPLTSTAPSATDEMQAELRRRLLRAMHIEETRGQRLVALREILHNLQN